MEFIQNKLVQVIFFLIILSLLGVLVYTVTDTIQEATRYRTCKTSVQTHAKLLDNGLKAKVEEIKCPANKITLKGNEQKVKGQLAEEMRECWDLYGEGKLNLFNGDGVFCSVCSIIEAEETKEVTAFRKYLVDAYVPGKGYSYLSYLQDFESQDAKIVQDYEQAISRESVNEKMIFNDDERYAVIFVDIKGQDLLSNYIKRSPQFAAAGGTMVVGAATAITGAGIAVATGVFFIKGGLGASATGIGATVGLVTAGVGTLLVIGGGAYAAIQARIAAKDFEHYSEVLLRPYTNETLTKEINCTHIPVRLFEE